MTDNNWADQSMFQAEPQEPAGEGRGILPEVYLLWMTPDPLGAVAAMSSMYSGRVVRDLSEITDDDRAKAFMDVQQTHLRAPLEAVKLHFLLEGVDRAFTHQLVRQRTAVYAQESLRFSVIGELSEAITIPPSIADLDHDDVSRIDWDRAISTINEVYHRLIDAGIPAEDARGLLPHCTATRVHYITDLRNLSDHAGNRLCTQAQFHWRKVFAGILRAIGTYPENHLDSGPDESHWQYEAIASSNIFRPVCYQLNKCPFQASFDRFCSIRDRVNLLSRNGITSENWDDSIEMMEWLLDPTAARKK
jgi:Thymidylate synthase complementing protein